MMFLPHQKRCSELLDIFSKIYTSQIYSTIKESEKVSHCDLLENLLKLLYVDWSFCVGGKLSNNPTSGTGLLMIYIKEHSTELHASTSFGY